MSTANSVLNGPIVLLKIRVMKVHLLLTSIRLQIWAHLRIIELLRILLVIIVIIIPSIIVIIASL